ncbi:response regulator [Actinomadura rupiterrae]|uniref:response regulator n=1 Tax=Actinomadura rupiterrae TaxID=559627 RepID=UPI0020A37E43|nr:response regulator transcription factor [Actinomadura rupiterrae]MCP2337068.1 DNA-binding NarL/FixJ family response regulator [Actinomadura rupiterrae]
MGGVLSESVRVLIAEDQALLRGSFRLLVDSAPGLEVVGEAGDGERAVELARRLRPDVVLMDVRMPVLDGVEATRRICGDPEAGGARVLVLTMFDLDAYVFAALRAGASGFLLKDTRPADLLEGIRVVASGESMLAPSVARRLVEAFARRSEVAIDGITDRERDVLKLVAEGLSNTEIAERLRLGLPTVKTHVGRLLSKLHARDRAQLVIIAYESGLAGR